MNSEKYGIHIDKAYSVTLKSSGNNIINITKNANLDKDEGYQDGIKIEDGKTSNINFTAVKKNIIKATNNGIYVGSNNESNVTFIAGNNNEFITGNNGIDHRGAGTVSITSTNGANIIRAGIKQNTVLESTKYAGYSIDDINKGQLIEGKDGDGIRTEGKGTVRMTAGTYNDIVARDSGLFINSKSENSTIELIANGSNETYGNIIYARQSGVENDGNTNNDRINKINVTAENAGNYIMAEKVAERADDGMFAAVYNKGNGSIKVEAKKDNVLIAVAAKNMKNEKNEINGVASDGTGKVDVISNEGNNVIFGTQNGILSNETGEINVTATQGNNIIGQYTNENGTSENGINVSAGTVTVKAGNQNSIYGTKTGITATGNDNNSPTVNLTAKINSNIISAGTVENSGIGAGIGNAVAINALNGSIVTLNAGNMNALAGTLYAEGNRTNVTLTAGRNNFIQSDQHREQTENGQKQNFVTALYARDNANVTLNAGEGGYNYIASKAKLDENELERTVWAHKGANIDINGTTFITASNADINTDSVSGMGNSKGVAITAGTGVGVGEYGLTDFNMKDDFRSQVNINGDAYITGDIASAYGGLVNINIDKKGKSYAHRTELKGNALAGNGGKLNLNLGDGGVWYGRADDYGDASVIGENGHQKFFAPAFSSAISEGGQVKLTMGDNSTWFVEGQSWITNIDTSNAKNAMINLVDSNTDRNTTAHALTVYNLNGDATFEMNLNGNRDVSDMLYIKKANGNYDISLAEAVTTEDMYANGLNGLRFATVGSGSNVNFRAGTYDRGFFNVEYEVGSDSYNNNHENAVYNGTELNAEKPGNDTVDNFFESTLKPGESQQTKPEEEQPTTRMAKAANNEIATLAETAEAQPAAETASSGNVNETTNFKLIARKSENMSDAGKTILNMSRANYNQAVYMDTLNKRMGEARYLDEDQEGLWVRMRHDKTDKDTGFEISTNMYELGYDKKYESKDGNGYHRRGVAIDYMDGDTSYDDIAGSGETNRKGIWVYDTWFGNKGHYTDYIAKWGHLENSFDLYTKTRGEKVSGEYDNDVYSISAEWGYKNILNEDKENPENNKDKWYIEPQLQMQYARVTGADYTTSQGTDVFVDGIDSLIARAGFRLGKDFGDDRKSTFYVKADVLHEFLGDQDITVKDKTTDGIARTIGYDNDGTWYTVGLGFSTMLSDHSYAFLDVEKLFGNDNDNSYQINGGVQWAL